eukprot:1434324-Rhodomonas_salina.1
MSCATWGFDLPLSLVDVHPDKHDVILTEPAFTNVPCNGQCFLQCGPGDGVEASHITGCVVAKFESEVDPPTPHKFFFDIKCRPAREKLTNVEERKTPPVVSGQVDLAICFPAWYVMPDDIDMVIGATRWSLTW